LQQVRQLIVPAGKPANSSNKSVSLKWRKS
jgi:hypothetical protein